MGEGEDRDVASGAQGLQSLGLDDRTELNPRVGGQVHVWRDRGMSVGAMVRIPLAWSWHRDCAKTMAPGVGGL